jgi:hypothetical protein
MAVCFCHPRYRGSINGRIVVQAGWGIKGAPISKITKAKRSGSMAQESLPGRYKPLSSDMSTIKNNQPSKQASKQTKPNNNKPL